MSLWSRFASLLNQLKCYYSYSTATYYHYRIYDLPVVPHSILPHYHTPFLTYRTPAHVVNCHRCEAPMRVCVRKLKYADHVKEYPSYRCALCVCATFVKRRPTHHTPYRTPGARARAARRSSRCGSSISRSRARRPPPNRRPRAPEEEPRPRPRSRRARLQLQRRPTLLQPSVQQLKRREQQRWR